MPINPIILQRRHAEVGRIRLGEKGAKGQPVKLTRFRLTSPQRELLEAAAELYGGLVKPWDNGGKAEFEVVTDTTSLPVIVVKGGLSQWMETWSGGGCVHRCDGVNDAVTGAECDPDDRSHAAAKPTTRLSVMLRDVESLGVWRMESHGYNAAAEIPAMAELAMYVGDLVPAVLHLVERRAVKDGKTSRFVVPVLDLLVSKQRLVELVGGAVAPAVGGTGPALAIAPAPAEQPATDWLGLVALASSADDCRALWRQAGESGELSPDVQDAITARVAEVTAAAPPAASSDTAVPGDVDAAWFALVAAAGVFGMTEPDLRAQLEQWSAQPVEDLTAEQLTAATSRLHELGSVA